MCFTASDIIFTELTEWFDSTELLQNQVDYFTVQVEQGSGTNSMWPQSVLGVDGEDLKQNNQLVGWVDYFTV